jgi:hypothetical protein
MVLYLGDKAGHEVKGLMDVREFIQQLDHAVIVFERMQPYPWQTVFPAD